MGYAQNIINVNSILLKYFFLFYSLDTGEFTANHCFPISQNHHYPEFCVNPSLDSFSLQFYQIPVYI